MTITDEEEERYKLETKCHLCNKDILNVIDDKVRNHDHLTGKFLGAAHNSCNLNYRINLKIFKFPVLYITFLDMMLI